MLNIHSRQTAVVFRKFNSLIVLKLWGFGVTGGDAFRGTGLRPLPAERLDAEPTPNCGALRSTSLRSAARIWLRLYIKMPVWRQCGGEMSHL